MVSAGAVALHFAPLLPPPPVLGEVPAFELVDERGERFGSPALAGKPYVVDFIYTACHDSCPRLTAQMAALQGMLADDPGAVRLVSVSVDPEHDTPEALSRYAKAAGAVPGRWTFLTGSLAAVTALVEGGYKVAMPEPSSPLAPTGLLHDNHLVVVDAKGRIRGYFSGDDQGRRAIRAALKRLLWGE